MSSNVKLSGGGRFGILGGMVIVIAIDQMTPKTNGTVISTVRLVESLRAKGHTVRVLACGARGKGEYGLRVRHIPIVSRVAWRQKVIFAQYDERKAREALDGADVVHLLMPFQLSRKLAELADELGVPVTAAFHLHPENILKNAGVLKYLSRLLERGIFWWWRVSFYDKVAAIHCPSEFIARELKKRGYRAKLCVFSNGVGAEFKPQSVKKQEDKFRILMVGRLAAEKRQDLLIRAAARSKYEQEIQLVFAGGGPRRWTLMKLAQFLLYNQPVFRFFEPRELIAEINRADLYVHAAETEVEGISCLEAMSAGAVPLIARAKKSATKDFIIDEHCGFAAGSVKDLTAKIDYFVENPKEREKIREKYLKYAKKFDLEWATMELERMFEYAAKRKK